MTVYLSGAVRPELAGREDAGYMLTPMMGNRPDLSATHWGADTGCYAAPERFTLDGYLNWLVGLLPYRHRCLFATAPDVVGDARATWERGWRVLPVIRALGFSAALVAQNGIHEAGVPWGAFDALFVGGDDEFKLRDERTWALVAEAKRRGVWTHMGRCNSGERFEAARLGGYDSADGTYLCFGPETNLPKLEGWLRRQRLQPALMGGDR